MNKITLAVPSNRGIQPQTFQCLMELVAHGGYDFHIMVAEEGYTIAENRNFIAVQACNNKSDYLFMIDDDMIFPPDTLDTLIANQKDICGVAYHSRGQSARMKAVEGKIMSIAEVAKEKYINLETNTDPQYKKPFKCYATGTGVILIKCSIFHKIPRPWFAFEWYESGQCKEGEDWHFCLEAKKAGFEVWADPIIKIGHLGQIIF